VKRATLVRREFLHRIGGDGRLETYGAARKLDVSWELLTTLRDLGRESAKLWLAENFDAIGVRSTLDVAKTLRTLPAISPLTDC